MPARRQRTRTRTQRSRPAERGSSNPLFRTSNPNFVAGQSGVNSYSAYQSPYGLGNDQTRENHALREQNFFGSANSTLDEYLERGAGLFWGIWEIRGRC